MISFMQDPRLRAKIEQSMTAWTDEQVEIYLTMEEAYLRDLNEVLDPGAN